MDFYKTLRIGPWASTKEIEQASERMLTIWDPEEFDEFKTVAQKVYDDILKAKTALLNPAMKEEYDRERRNRAVDGSEVTIDTESGRCVKYKRPWVRERNQEELGGKISFDRDVLTFEDKRKTNDDGFDRHKKAKLPLNKRDNLGENFNSSSSETVSLKKSESNAKHSRNLEEAGRFASIQESVRSKSLHNLSEVKDLNLKIEDDSKYKYVFKKDHSGELDESRTVVSDTNVGILNLFQSENAVVGESKSLQFKGTWTPKEADRFQDSKIHFKTSSAYYLQRTENQKLKEEKREHGVSSDGSMSDEEDTLGYTTRQHGPSSTDNLTSNANGDIPNVLLSNDVKSCKSGVRRIRSSMEARKFQDNNGISKSTSMNDLLGIKILKMKTEKKKKDLRDKSDEDEDDTLEYTTYHDELERKNNLTPKAKNIILNSSPPQKPIPKSSKNEQSRQTCSSEEAERTKNKKDSEMATTSKCGTQYVGRERKADTDSYKEDECSTPSERSVVKGKNYFLSKSGNTTRNPEKVNKLTKLCSKFENGGSRAHFDSDDETATFSSGKVTAVKSEGSTDAPKYINVNDNKTEFLETPRQKGKDRTTLNTAQENLNISLSDNAILKDDEIFLFSSRRARSFKEKKSLTSFKPTESCSGSKRDADSTRKAINAENELTTGKRLQQSKNYIESQKKDRSNSKRKPEFQKPLEDSQTNSRDNCAANKLRSLRDRNSSNNIEVSRNIFPPAEISGKHPAKPSSISVYALKTEDHTPISSDEDIKRKQKEISEDANIIQKLHSDDNDTKGSSVELGVNSAALNDNGCKARREVQSKLHGCASKASLLVPDDVDRIPFQRIFFMRGEEGVKNFSCSVDDLCLTEVADVGCKALRDVVSELHEFVSKESLLVPDDVDKKPGTFISESLWSKSRKNFSRSLDDVRHTEMAHSEEEIDQKDRDATLSENLDRSEVDCDYRNIEFDKFSEGSRHGLSDIRDIRDDTDAKSSAVKLGVSSVALDNSDDAENLSRVGRKMQVTRNYQINQSQVTQKCYSDIIDAKNSAVKLGVSSAALDNSGCNAPRKAVSELHRCASKDSLLVPDDADIISENLSRVGRKRQVTRYNQINQSQVTQQWYSDIIDTKSSAVKLGVDSAAPDNSGCNAPQGVASELHGCASKESLLLPDIPESQVAYIERTLHSRSLHDMRHTEMVDSKGEIGQKDRDSMFSGNLNRPGVASDYKNIKFDKFSENSWHGFNGIRGLEGATDVNEFPEKNNLQGVSRGKQKLADHKEIQSVSSSHRSEAADDSTDFAESIQSTYNKSVSGVDTIDISNSNQNAICSASTNSPITGNTRKSSGTAVGSTTSVQSLNNILKSASSSSMAKCTDSEKTPEMHLQLLCSYDGKGAVNEGREGQNSTRGSRKSRRSGQIQQDISAVNVRNVKILRLKEGRSLRCASWLNIETDSELDISRLNASSKTTYERDGQWETLTSKVKLKDSEMVTVYRFKSGVERLEVYFEGSLVCRIDDGEPEELSTDYWESEDGVGAPSTMTVIVKANDAVFKIVRLRANGTEGVEVYRNGKPLYILENENTEE